jgi:NAD(P)-dependent dehydrogenase (short-subunit alcohol dehydrogenase family)
MRDSDSDTLLLRGKVALITGASRGIGAAVAERFAKEGARLILVARDMRGLEETDDRIRRYQPEGATLVVNDLQQFARIEELGYAIADRFKGLDILVGNAGILGTMCPVTNHDHREWFKLFDVNVHANWFLLKTMEPMLKKAMQGRAMFVTSDVAQKTKPYWAGYSVTKAAMQFMVQLYAEEIKNTYPQFKVNLIDPGTVQTDMLNQALRGVDKSGYPKPEEITDIFVELARDACSNHGEILKA